MHYNNFITLPLPLIHKLQKTVVETLLKREEKKTLAEKKTGRKSKKTPNRSKRMEAIKEDTGALGEEAHGGRRERTQEGRNPT